VSNIADIIYTHKTSPIIKHVHITETGLQLFVGPLEATILVALWDINEPFTMAKLYKYLSVNNITECAYSTIITTLQRMADKQLIIRIERENSTPLWAKAFENEEHFIECCMIDTLNVLYNNYPDHVIGYIGA
jgi:predicted transcriptional regulator